MDESRRTTRGRPLRPGRSRAPLSGRQRWLPRPARRERPGTARLPWGGQSLTPIRGGPAECAVRRSLIRHGTGTRLPRPASLRVLLPQLIEPPPEIRTTTVALQSGIVIALRSGGNPGIRTRRIDAHSEDFAGGRTVGGSVAVRVIGLDGGRICSGTNAHTSRPARRRAGQEGGRERAAPAIASGA